MEFISFFDEETQEEISFEVIDQLVEDNQRYILVADEDDNATILQEINDDDEEITYALIEDEALFDHLHLLFLESDEYDLEV